MITEGDRKQFRDANKTRREYFKGYYKNNQRHKDKMDRLAAMHCESGYRNEYDSKKEVLTEKMLLEKGHILTIDDVTLYSLPYAISKITYLNEMTVREYFWFGVIPEPIYIRKKNGRIKKYLSKRQLRMINNAWNKSTKKHNKEKISEYLHANWLNGELGFRGESDD